MFHRTKCKDYFLFLQNRLRVCYFRFYPIEYTYIRFKDTFNLSLSGLTIADGQHVLKLAIEIYDWLNEIEKFGTAGNCIQIFPGKPDAEISIIPISPIEEPDDRANKPMTTSATPPAPPAPPAPPIQVEIQELYTVVEESDEEVELKNETNDSISDSESTSDYDDSSSDSSTDSSDYTDSD